jgi:hypothetical protein
MDADMLDPRINRDAVASAIYAERNRRRVIWSPSTTLLVMGIERYPHDLPDRYRQMKAVLDVLCAEGLLRRRPHLHSRYTLKEVAYWRAAVLGSTCTTPADAAAGTTNDK